MSISMGFKSMCYIDAQYALRGLKPKEGVRQELGGSNSIDVPVWFRTLFFAVAAVKFIGESYHSESNSQPAESSAARGSCAKFNEVKV